MPVRNPRSALRGRAPGLDPLARDGQRAHVRRGLPSGVRRPPGSVGALRGRTQETAYPARLHAPPARRHGRRNPDRKGDAVNRPRWGALGPTHCHIRNCGRAPCAPADGSATSTRRFHASHDRLDASNRRVEAAIGHFVTSRRRFDAWERALEARIGVLELRKLVPTYHIVVSLPRNARSQRRNGCPKLRNSRSKWRQRCLGGTTWPAAPSSVRLRPA